VKKVVTKKNQKILTKFLVGIILLAIGIYGQSKSSGDVKLDTSQSGYYDVVSIADGDTITVNMEGKKEKIRFIGVDTPEVYHGGDTAPSECYADQAKEFVASGIDNKRVKLVADDKGSNRDKYGRLLRYVYTHDDRNLDELLVSEGYGFAVDGFAYSKKESFLNLMEQAKQSRKGLWAVCGIDYSKGYPEVSK